MNGGGWFPFVGVTFLLFSFVLEESAATVVA